MKKWIAMILTAVMLLALAACGAAEEEGSAQLEITRAPEEATEAPAQAETEAPAEAKEEGVYSFTYEGAELIPGQAFDASVLPEAASTYSAPSCAIEGTDNVYSYGPFEVTAFDEGKGEFIYSVYILDPNITTAEGLALGDPMTKAEKLYGAADEVNENEHIYRKGDTQLVIISKNDAVASIEFRLDVE